LRLGRLRRKLGRGIGLGRRFGRLSKGCAPLRKIVGEFFGHFPALILPSVAVSPALILPTANIGARLSLKLASDV
jgi:hypothetical protein